MPTGADSARSAPPSARRPGPRPRRGGPRAGASQSRNVATLSALGSDTAEEEVQFTLLGNLQALAAGLVRVGVEGTGLIRPLRRRRNRCQGFSEAHLTGE